MSDLDSAAEIRKLAHGLGVAPERLAALAHVAPADLKALRRQLAEALFEADRAHFGKVAALSKAVPVALAAKIAETVLPPLIGARTAELLEPHKAAELVGRISDGYLADVAAAMDPARAAHVVAQIPAERVARVGRELARRGEWVVIGGFVAEVSSSALAATVAEFDGEQLLRIGFVLEDPARLDEITALVTDAQLDAVLAAAAGHGLWTELDDLVSHLGDERAARLAARLAVASEPVREAVTAAAAEGRLGPAGAATLCAAGG